MVFEEVPTLKRSNAFEYRRRGVPPDQSSDVGILDITGFSRYEVSGPKADEWLDHMVR